LQQRGHTFHQTHPSEKGICFWFDQSEGEGIQCTVTKEGLGLWVVEERAIKRCATMQTLSEGENMALGGAAAFVEAVSVLTAHCVSQFGPVAWECRAQLRARTMQSAFVGHHCDEVEASLLEM
jgi:hypothetical protein